MMVRCRRPVNTSPERANSDCRRNEPRREPGNVERQHSRVRQSSDVWNLARAETAQREHRGENEADAGAPGSAIVDVWALGKKNHERKCVQENEPREDVARVAG